MTLRERIFPGVRGMGLLGSSFSKSLVSQLASGLDSELEAWRSRRLEAEAYPYLFVDAR
jgi:transposase-like protein